MRRAAGTRVDRAAGTRADRTAGTRVERAGTATTIEARHVEGDVRAELDSHLELASDALVAEGRSPEDARREALRRFGDVERIAHQCTKLKLRNQNLMKATLIVLVVALVFVTGAFAYTTIEMRRETELRYVVARRAQAQAERMLARRETVRLGAADVPQSGDRIDVSSPTHTVLNTHGVQVDLGGAILLPDLGHVTVTDKTRDELQDWLVEAYSQYFIDAPIIFVDIERRE